MGDNSSRNGISLASGSLHGVSSFSDRLAFRSSRGKLI